MNDKTKDFGRMIDLALTGVIVPTTIEIPLDRIADTLCAALEGGSNYWCEKLEVEHYHGVEWAHEAVAVGTPFKLYVFEEDDVYEIANSRERLIRTLTIMSEKHRKHFLEMVDEHEDANTGDVLFQLLCFAEVIYG